MQTGVLILCAANVCRSPVAEALWRQRALRLGRPHPVSSAGLDAQPGQPPDAVCVEWLAERGINLRAHRSQRLNLASLARFELILAMELWQVQRVRSAAPLFAGRVQLLGRWGVGAIADPHGGPREGYVPRLDDIDISVNDWLQRL